MIGKSIACLALIAWAGAVSAQLTVYELEQQPFNSEIVSLFALEQGDLLLRVRGFREPHERSSAPDDTYFGPWNFIYVLGPDGKVKDRVELPPQINPFVVPYRNGFAMQRPDPEKCSPHCQDGSGPLQIVAYERATEAEPKVLYASGEPANSARLYGTSDAQNLYVLQSDSVTRIDASGHVAWQKTVALLDHSSFVATDDGVAFAVYVSQQDPTMVLRALDRDGQPRWETLLPHRPGGEPIYSAAGFIVVPAYVPSVQGPYELRFLTFDTRTGQLAANVTLQPFQYATGTRQGVLFAGLMLGQSYLGMLGRDGKFVWLRRYVADKKISDIQQAAVTGNGNLLLVTRERQATSTIPLTSIVLTDSTAASLADARGGCLDPNWSQAAEHETLLRARNLWIEPPKPEEMATARRCSDREKQYMSFNQALLAAMGKASAQSPERRQTFAVRLTPAGEPIRLEQYSVSYGGFTGGGISLSFAVPYDSAPGFWKIFSTEVQTHLRRMQQLGDRFEQMTGLRYGISERSPGSVGDILSGLEKAASIVNQRIATIAPEELAAIGRPWSDGAQFHLRPDAFGSGDAMFPLDVADRTLLDILRRNREAEARGDRL